MTTSPSKTVKRTRRTDLEYEIEGTAWTIRADFGPIVNEADEIESPGIIHYLRPDENGLSVPPDETNCEQFMFAALPEKQRKKFAKAVVDGSFPSYLVYDAALTGWQNTVGIADIERANERRLQLVIERLKKLESAEEQHQFLAALKGEEPPKKEEDDDVDPTED